MGHVLQAAAVGLVGHALFLLAVAMVAAGPAHGHLVEAAAPAVRAHLSSRLNKHTTFVKQQVYGCVYS